MPLAFALAAALLTLGAGLAWPPAGAIVGGFLLFAASWHLTARGDGGVRLGLHHAVEFGGGALVTLGLGEVWAPLAGLAGGLLLLGMIWLNAAGSVGGA